MGTGRAIARTARALLAALLTTAGVVGLTGGASEPAGAAIVEDQPLSAVASGMWQTNNTVWALDVADHVVYAGGTFTAVRPPGALPGTGEVTRNHLAAFDAGTGALITSFNPNVNGAVYDVNVANDGTKLYVVGSFTTVGGQTRQRIARLNLPSGTLDTAWTANADDTVMTVASDDDAVYVGGDFGGVKGVARTRIAKLTTTNGNVVTAFNASSDKRISESAIAPDGSRVLVGGENDIVNGQPQGGIASLDPTTGALMPWAATGVSPRLADGGCDANVTDIVVRGSTAYVTAEAPRPGCWEGYYAANISDGGLLYNERCLGGSAALAIVNDWMYRGSHNHDCSKNPGGYVGPTNANNFVWHRLEAHRLSDGRLGHWSPNTNGGSPGTATTVGPQVLASDGSNLYVGGDFSTVNQQNQQGLTRFTPTGGNSAPTAPGTPRVRTAAAGTLEISAETGSDDNDGVLTYALYRDGGTTPVATTTMESWPWSPGVVQFADSGLMAGTTHTYQLTASDGAATSIRGPASVPTTVGWANPPDYPTAVDAAGATVHWRLDDPAGPLADHSGNGNAGDLVGDVATGQPGAVLDDSAIETNGVDAYVTSTNPITPSAAFTESVWFSTTSDRGGALMGFSDAKTGVGALDNRAIWMDNDGKVGFGIRRGNVSNPSMSFVKSPGTYNDGAWHQATAVSNGTDTLNLYLDGSIVATTPVTQPILPGAGYLRVGYLDLTHFYDVFGRNFDGYPAVMTYFWAGRVDEAVMYAGTLTDNQVAGLYAAGAAHGAPLPPEQPDPGPPSPPPPPSSYPTAVSADAPSMYWRLNEPIQTTVADASGNNRTGTYRNGLTYGVPGALTDDSTAVRSPGSSGVAYSNQQRPAPTTFSLEAWIKTSSFNGGKILGYENAQTGWGTSYDRQLYMTNNGRIAYGIVAGGVQQTVTSSGSYNDDVWHHVVATQGAAGMSLYVDAVLAAANPTATPDAYNGFWRLAGGNLTGWPNAPASSALSGTYDEVAVYPAELTADQVATHHDPGVAPSDAPGNLHTTGSTPTSVALAWDAPAGTVIGYRVYRDGVLVGSPSGTSFDDTGLTGSTAYQYSVSAVNGASLESPQTVPLPVTTPAPAPDVTPPPTPANLAAPTVTGTSVVLTWDASTDSETGVAGYEVRRDGTLIATTAGTGYSDLTVAPNQSYAYTVLAKDGAGNPSPETSPLVVSTPAEVDTTPPSIPLHLRVVSRAATEIRLAWDASDDDTGVTAYILTRNGVDLPPTAGTTLSDELLAPGGSYTYTVRAEDGARNDSDPSDPVTVTTHLTPETVFAAGSVWKFTDDGIDRGTAWNESAYDDSAWKSGAGQLGYGDGDETTVMFNGGATPSQRWISHYLRRSFTISDAAEIGGLTLSALRDDGIVVYVNGVEAFRDNMPSGTITSTTFASSGLFGAAESTYVDFAIPPSLLHDGVNVIAVSLHNDTRQGSGDISFDAGLTATYP